MDIRNVTQFVSYISNELSSLDFHFQQSITCLGDFSRQCNCHRRSDKDKIYQNCNRLYMLSAKIAATRFKNEFLNKTTDRQILFYSDGGELIAIISR